MLINSAAQEEVPDGLLGRVTGLVSLVHRGAHATGLLLVSPLFAVIAAQSVFAAAAVAIPRHRPRRARAQRPSSRSSSTRDESKPSILSIAPAAAAAAPAGISPTSSEPTTSAPREARLLFDARDDVVQRGGLPVLDVHAHLDEACARQVETEGPDSREAAAGLANDRGDGLSRLELAAQVDVERDERPACADEDAAGRSSSWDGPKSGSSSPESIRR